MLGTRSQWMGVLVLLFALFAMCSMSTGAGIAATVVPASAQARVVDRFGLRPSSFLLSQRLRGGRRAVHDEEDEDDEDDDEIFEDEEDDDEDYDEEEDLEDTPKPSRKRKMRKGKSSGKKRKMDMYDDDEEDILDEDEDEDEDVDVDEDEDEDMVAGSQEPGMMRLEGREHAEVRDETEQGAENILTLTAKGYLDGLAKGLQRLRESQSLCDVSLVTSDGVSVPAHSAVLGAASLQLRTMMERAVGQDSKGEAKGKAGAAKTAAPPAASTPKITLSDVSATTLHSLLDFVYCGRVKVAEDRLPMVLGASEKLGVEGLRDACSAHLLRDLTADNALRMRALGVELGCSELLDAAHAVVMEEFGEVSRSAAFLELKEDAVRELISSDDLLVDTEKQAFDAVVRWVGHDEASRASKLLPLLSAVRLGRLPLDVLAKKVAANAVVQRHLGSNSEWQAMVNAALAYVGSSKEQRERLQGSQTRERLGSKGRFLMAVGGRRGASAGPVRRCWVMDRMGGEWEEMLPMAAARKQVMAAQLHRKLYAVGGWNGRAYLRTVEVFEPSKSAWFAAPRMNQARGSFGLAEGEGELVVVGGFDGQEHLTGCEAFNGSGTWKQLPPLGTGRSGARAASVRGSVFAVGGFDGKEVVKSVERLDRAGGKWVAVAPMREARRDAAVAVLDGQLFVAGGFDGKQDLSSVEQYHADEDRWAEVPGMQHARSGLALAVFHKKLYAVGGYDGSKYLASAEVYDPQTQSWSLARDRELPCRMAHFGLAVL